jgi:WD40 repeat protein/ankyrin repeat protein
MRKTNWREIVRLGGLSGFLIGVPIALFAQQAPRPTMQADRKAATRPQLALQWGHTEEVESMVFSPDSTLLVTASQDGEVKLWDLRTGDQLRSFKVDAIWPAGLAFSPDGKTLVCFAGSGKALLYDTVSGRRLRTLDYGSEPVGIAFSADGSTLALGGPEGTLSLWDARTGKRLRSISTHVSQTGEVSVLAFSPDGSLLACADGDAFGNGSVEIWNVQNGSLVTTLLSNAVHSVSFSPDGQILAVGAGGFSPAKPVVELWNLAQRKVVKRLAGREFEPLSLAFSPDGRRIAAGDAQGFLTVWDIAVGTVLRTMGVKDFVVHAAIGPGSRLGATSDHNGTVRVYALESGKLLHRFSAPAYFWDTATFSADGASLLLGGGVTNDMVSTPEDRNVLLSWDLLSGNWKDLQVGPGHGVHHIAVSPLGTQAVSSDTGEIQVWNLQQGEARTLSAGKRRIMALAVSPTDPTVVVGGDQPKAKPPATPGAGRQQENDPFLAMIDLRTGETIRTLTGHKNLVDGVHYSADGSRLATISYDRSLILWDAHTGKQEHRVATGSDTPECLALSRDGRLAVIGYEDGPVQMLDTRTGHVVRSFALPGQVTWSVALSPHEDWVAAGGSDGSVRAWNIRTGQRREMRPGNHALDWIGFSPEGTHLASLDKQGFLRLWDVRTGSLLVTYLMFGPQDWIVFTPAGYYEGSANVDKFLRWRVGNEILPADRYRAQFYRPDLVQTRLSGKPQPERYAQLLHLEETLRLRLAASEAALPPVKQPEKEANPATAALKKALTKVGELGDPELRKKVHAQVKAQLAAGADPNVQDDWGTSPLMFLVACGDREGVQALLDRKVDVNRVDFHGLTALLHAVSREQEAMIPLLLGAGADLKDEKGRSLLKLKGDRAAGGAAMVRLLKLGVHRFEAPLQFFDFEDTAWMLLFWGADPNARDAEGGTPLMYAFSPHLLKALLLKGADPNVRDKSGMPMIGARSSGGHTELVQLLLDYKADPNAADPAGGTALMFATQNGYSDLAKLLLARGANPNQPARDGSTPLMMAIGDGYLGITQALVAHGAQVNAQDSTGWTPLMYAVNRKDATTVKLLLSKGADIHVRNDKKQTLLQQITSLDPNDSFGVAQILKQAGARR